MLISLQPQCFPYGRHAIPARRCAEEDAVQLAVLKDQDLLAARHPTFNVGAIPENGHYSADLLLQRIAFEEEFMAVGAGRGSQNRR
jgi:hypothetical protein